MIFISQQRDPWLNFAIEDWIMQELLPADPLAQQKILLLWVNDSSLCIGRFQNPWLECHLPKMLQAAIPLVRRQSGGGTVYHDPGNLNFSFISSKGIFQKKAHLQMICQALARLDVAATINDRNDLLVEGKKVSGSAYKESKAKALHHGTLLVAADLSQLRGLLQVPPKTIITRSTPSVRSPVINLQEVHQHLDLAKVMSVVAHEVAQSWWPNPPAVTYLFIEDFPDTHPVWERYHKWRTVEWTYGETPPFQQHLQQDFSWGSVSGQLQVHKGKIRHCQLQGQEKNSPSQQQNLAQKLQHLALRLIDKNYGDSEVESIIAQQLQGGEEEKEVQAWLRQEFF